MSKRPLVPSFLQKADDKLLRNKPGTWATRAHLVLYFAAAFALLLFIFCYAVFFDARQYSSIVSWNVFVGLVAFIGFIFWLIYLLRFNVFKRYGNWNSTDGWRDFGLYFISIAAMVAVCFIPAAVETMRANQQFTDEEIVKDINELNVNACRLEYNNLPLQWRFDTCKVVNNKYTAVVTPAPVDTDVVAADTVVTVIDDTEINDNDKYVPNYTYLDTGEFRNKMENADSLVKINDSTYVFYESPDYRFVNSYNADNYSKEKMLSSAAIYKQFLKYYQKPDREALLKRMQQLQTKYAINGRYYHGNYNEIDINDAYDTRIAKKYDLTRIGYGIDNVVYKKQAWKQDWHIYLRFFYYITLVLTMLVFIFRHSTRKTFFLSVLTALLLTIITGLMMAVSYGDEGASILSFMIAYYAVFAILALSVFKTQIRSAVQGIGLNLFLFATPFIPLIFLGLNRVLKYQNETYYERYQMRDPRQEAMYFLIAEIAGSVLLVVLIQPLFKRLYRKWYSSPEQ